MLNEVLGKIIGREDYRLTPKAIKVDKNGTNFCGIKVFGLDFMMSKVVGCQMHFKNYEQSGSANCGTVSKKNLKMCSKMSTVATVADYNKQKSA